MYSENKIYKLIDLGLLNVRNIDLPRKVRFRQRTKNVAVYKIDKHCLENRTYEDYECYIKNIQIHLLWKWILLRVEKVEKYS